MNVFYHSNKYKLLHNFLGLNTTLHIVQGNNHFSIINKMGNAFHPKRYFECSSLEMSLYNIYIYIYWS